MKKLILVFMVSLTFVSCKKDDNSNSNNNSNNNSNSSYDIGYAWQHDSWTYNGSQMLDNYTAILFICEEDSVWANVVFDLQDNLTDLTSLGTFTVNSNKTSGTFTQLAEYNPNTDDFDLLTVPLTIGGTINKLDDDELDITFSYAGNTEIITTVKSPTYDPCDL